MSISSEMSVKEFLLFSIMLKTDASERNYMYFNIYSAGTVQYG